LVADTIGALITSGTVVVVNASGFTVLILTVLTLHVVGDVLYVTNVIWSAFHVISTFGLVANVCILIALWEVGRAVRVNIATTLMRFSLSSTDWLVCWALVVTRTSCSAHGVVTVFTGVVGPGNITHSCQAV